MMFDASGREMVYTQEEGWHVAVAPAKAPLSSRQPTPISRPLDFRAATNALFLVIGQAELAVRMGASHSAIKQARLGPNSRSYRKPPNRWREAVGSMARELADHFQALAAEMERD